ncbi:MAG: hypothetical protein WA997_20130 [Anaerolineales bacterium]|nr:hypothetical protein [Anaerolineales bacterium]
MESTQTGETANNIGNKLNPESDPDACLHPGDSYLEPQLTVRISLVKIEAEPNKPYLGGKIKPVSLARRYLPGKNLLNPPD